MDARFAGRDARRYGRPEARRYERVAALPTRATPAATPLGLEANGCVYPRWSLRSNPGLQAGIPLGLKPAISRSLVKTVFNPKSEIKPALMFGGWNLVLPP